MAKKRKKLNFTKGWLFSLLGLLIAGVIYILVVIYFSNRDGFWSGVLNFL